MMEPSCLSGHAILDVSVQDTNNGYDLFTHNLVTGVTQRVTYKTGGGQRRLRISS